MGGMNFFRSLAAEFRGPRRRGARGGRRFGARFCGVFAVGVVFCLIASLFALLTGGASIAWTQRGYPPPVA